MPHEIPREFRNGSGSRWPEVGGDDLTDDDLGRLDTRENLLQKVLDEVELAQMDIAHELTSRAQERLQAVCMLIEASGEVTTSEEH